MHPSGDTSVREAAREALQNYHHTNFQRVEKRFTFYKPATKLFLFQCLYVTNIPTTRIYGVFLAGYSWAYNYSWIILGVQLFLDIVGSSWAYNYSWIRRKSSNFGFVSLYFWFIFYIFNAVYGINDAQ